MRLELTHHAYDLFPTVGLEVRLEFTDGESYTVASFEVPDDDLDAFIRLPQDLTDAFLWGDGSQAVVSTVAGFDRSRQSRRVHRTLPPG